MLETQGEKELGEGVEGGRGELLVVGGVEVVDVVSAHDQEEAPQQQL